MKFSVKDRRACAGPPTTGMLRSSAARSCRCSVNSTVMTTRVSLSIRPGYLAPALAPAQAVG